MTRSGVPFLSVLAIAVVAFISPCADAQTNLTPADLKRVNALSGNTFAWAVLRKSIAMALESAGEAELAARADSVDTIAAILALEDPENRLMPVLSGASRGGLMAADRAELVGSIGLDSGRALGLACLVYGQAPVERELLANLVQLAASDRGACAQHYTRIRDHWLEAAAAIRIAPGDVQSDVSVEYGPASGSLASARSVIIAGETVDEVGFFLSRTIRFASPVRLAGTSCGKTEVEIDAAGGQVTFCYELLGELVESIGRSIGG